MAVYSNHIEHINDDFDIDVANLDYIVLSLKNCDFNLSDILEPAYVRATEVLFANCNKKS